MNYKKESALLGILGALMFFVGYSVFPYARIGLYNPYQILGFLFVILSLANPWYPQISKALKRL